MGESGYMIQPNNINTISDIGYLTPAYLSVKLTFTTVDKNGTGHMLIHSKQLVSVPLSLFQPPLCCFVLYPYLPVYRYNQLRTKLDLYVLITERFLHFYKVI